MGFKRRLIDRIGALHVWKCDAYDYGSCAGDVDGALDQAKDEVLAIIDEELKDERPGKKKRTTRS